MMLKSLSDFALRIFIIIFVVSSWYWVVSFRPTGGIMTVELSLARDLTSQLTSAASIYEKEQGRAATNFLDFVEAKNQVAESPKTISVAHFGTLNGGCTVEKMVIDCTKAFKKMETVKYYWPQNKITSEIKRKN